jgi:hypothetical protein
MTIKVSPSGFYTPTLWNPRTVPLGRVRVDMSHPLAQGMIGCWIPGTNGGKNLVEGQPDLIKNSGFQLDTTVEGPSDYSFTSGVNGGLTAILPPSSAFVSGTTMSQYWRGVPMANPFVAGANLVGVNYGTADNSPYAVWMLNITGNSGTNWGQIRADWNSGGTFHTSSSGINLSGFYGNPCSAAATYNVNGNVNTYGRDIGNGSFLLGATDSFGGSVPTNTGTDPLTINCYSAAAGRATNGKTLIAIVWNVELTAAQLAWVDRDPYCFLIPVDDIVGYQVISGSGSVGSTSGIGTATAVGASAFAAVGSSSGTGTATAVGASLFAAVASSSGVGTATGISVTGSAVGAVSASATVIGVSASTFSAVGTASGTSTVTGINTSGVVVGGKQWRWKEDYEKYVENRPPSHTEIVKKAAAILSKMGGHARAESLTSKQRTNIAITAAKARWNTSKR